MIIFLNYSNIMETKILLIATVISCMTSCKTGGNSDSSANGAEMLVCSLDKVTQTETIPLSRLVESCNLIQFEDIDDALFKAWFTTVSEKYIMIRQQNKNAFKLFDRSGKFLCDVGAVGNGPGEYATALYDEVIDDRNDLIYLSAMTGDKILVYNTAGKFIKNIVSPQPLHKPKLHLSGDGILTVVHMAFPNEKAMVLQFDERGEIVGSLAPPAHLIVKSYDGEIFTTRNTPAFEFMHTRSDTLYHYNIGENKIQPVFTATTSLEKKPFRQYLELNTGYLTNVFGKGLVYTDKKRKTSSYVEIVNDYYGNLPVPGNIVTLRNGWFVHNLEPGQLSELIEKRLKENDCTDPDRHKLEKLLSSLDENANNLLFVGKLK
jgi:hypothetical protein